MHTHTLHPHPRTHTHTHYGQLSLFRSPSTFTHRHPAYPSHTTGNKRNAGNDQVVAHLSGPSTLRVRAEHTSEGNYAVRYAPEHAGRYELRVFANDLEFPGGPWDVVISDRSQRLVRSFLCFAFFQLVHLTV